jgi:hypothetical protein
MDTSSNVKTGKKRVRATQACVTCRKKKVNNRKEGAFFFLGVFLIVIKCVDQMRWYQTRMYSLPRGKSDL